MRPEEILRRYLEQRREMGEREMLLDALGVDEVMRLLGARAEGPPATARAPEDTAGGAPAGAPAPAGDWRATLGGAPRGAGQATPGSLPRGASVASRRATASPPGSTADSAADSAAGPEGATRGVPEGGPRRMESGLSVGGSGTGLFAGPLSDLGSLSDIADVVRRCTRCPLYATAANPVPGEGNEKARLVCVGEAPGANEDETGRPFVGAAGQLLTKILAAIDLAREDVFIANVLKHRPPGNRNPRPEEVDACKPYLIRQLELIAPKVIIAFGTFAAQTLLETKLPIGKLRGLVHRYHGIPLVVTYHPAALLRNPAWKRPTWEDVQLARRLLDSPAA